MKDSEIKTFNQTLRDRGLTISIAESLTAGLVGGSLARISGSSDILDSGFIVYNDAAKTGLLGVPSEMLVKFSAVSEPVARAMAIGVLERSPADIAVSVTGYAEYEGRPDMAGLVYIGLAYVFNPVSGTRVEQPLTEVHEYHFSGVRNDVRDQTVDTALGHVSSLLGRLKR